AMVVGAREGKYNRDGSSNMIPGHSIPMILASIMLMLIGWSPYMISAAPALVPSATVANVLISAAAGGLTSMAISQLRFGKADILLTISGILAGLVAITAVSSRVGSAAALLIGLIAGLIVPWMMVMIDLSLKIDDPAGVIAIHGVGGLWA